MNCWSFFLPSSFLRVPMPVPEDPGLPVDPPAIQAACYLSCVKLDSCFDCRQGAALLEQCLNSSYDRAAAEGGGGGGVGGGEGSNTVDLSRGSTHCRCSDVSIAAAAAASPALDHQAEPCSGECHY